MKKTRTSPTEQDTLGTTVRQLTQREQARVRGGEGEGEGQGVSWKQKVTRD
jgi:hypothetical protein